MSASIRRLMGFLAPVLDARPYLHLFRLVHYYNCSHARQRRRLTLEEGVRMAPNVSLRNGERISATGP
jgi:hypothetical protein